MKNNDELFYEIETVCEGVVCISETDAPVLAFAGGATMAVSAELILQQVGLPASSPIEEKEFDGFFARLTTIRDWYGEAETGRARKFTDLQKRLVYV